jgi:hypothetical protein
VQPIHGLYVRSHHSILGSLSWLASVGYMVPMTRIVTTPKPRYQRRKAPTNAAPVETRIVTATKPGKRVRPSDDADGQVLESVKECFKRMMQPS